MQGEIVDQIERIDRATSFAAEKVTRVRGADMSKRTPCAEFDVKELLNHLIGNLGMLATVAKGETAERPQGDQFGSDPGAAYRERRRELMSALAVPGVFDRDWVLPFGTLPGRTMAGIAFMEHLTHGWDVAKATGQDDTIPADLVEECMGVVKGAGDMLRMPGVCGPPVEVPDDASAQDKFIAFMGRTP
jgi:uncharacterized protein (TIGR03086 family)